jgi:hypothetical protein
MRRASTILALLALAPAAALAWGAGVHDLFPPRALERTMGPARGFVEADTLPGVTDGQRAAFRTWLWNEARRLGDDSLRAQFLSRYPDPASFDAGAFRRLLAAGDAAPVLGVDSFAAVYGALAPGVRDSYAPWTPASPIALLDALRLGSTFPNLDGRRGEHAAGEAPDLAQLYTDLAILAWLNERAGFRTLGALWAGAAMHFVADAGSPIGTVPDGVPEIHRDAGWRAFWGRARRLFGLFGRAPPRERIAAAALGNLSGLSGRLFEQELREAVARSAGGRFAGVALSMHAPVAALRGGSDSLRRALQDTLGVLLRGSLVPDFARAVTHVLLGAGPGDGAAIWEVMRFVARPAVARGRVAVDFDTVPDERLPDYVRDPSRPDVRRALDRFNQLQGRGVARTTEALRWWWGRLVVTTFAAPDRRREITQVVLARFVAERLRYFDAADRRREQALHP